MKNNFMISNQLFELSTTEGSEIICFGTGDVVI